MSAAVNIIVGTTQPLSTTAVRSAKTRPPDQVAARRGLNLAPGKAVMIAMFAALVLSVADKEPFDPIHAEAMQRAQVMHEAPAIEDLQLDVNPNGGHGFRPDELVECR